MRAWNYVVVLFVIALTGCANLTQIKSPEISLVSIEPAKTKGFSQYFSLNLLVTNPNSFDLDIEGVTFKLGVADQNVFSGVSNAVPLLKAYSETEVTLSAGVNLFDLLKLISYFSEHYQEEIKYSLVTSIDPNGFIPITVSRTGVLTDELLSGIKKGKKR